MNMLLTAVLVCLALSTTAEPNTQARQQLMEAKISEVHHEMKTQREEMNNQREAIINQEQKIKQLNLEIDALRNDKLENTKQMETYKEQLNGAVMDQLEMREQLQATQDTSTSDLEMRMAHVEGSVATFHQQLLGFVGQSQLTSLDYQIINGMQTSLNDARKLIADVINNVENVDERVHKIEGAASGERFSFLASLTTAVGGNDDDIVFDRVQYNHGSTYSASTGEYTVPMDGVYLFTATAHVKGSQADSELWINVDAVIAAFVQSSQAVFRNKHHDSLTCTLQLQLRAGQKVNAHTYKVAEVYGNSVPIMYSWFSGYRIE